MRQLIIFSLMLISYCSIAQKSIKTIDIINTSDLSLTVTYNVCHMEHELRRIVYDSIRDQYLYDFAPPHENCFEKKAILGGINTGTNLIEIIATDQVKATKVGEKSIDNAVVYVTKIESSLGMQIFISSYEETKKSEGVGEIGLCYGINSRYHSNGGNVIELDNKGTNKIYCQSSYQPN
ncbi:TPA: hypothetical protein I8Y96_002267 [Legionella pneumophila]|nr:hypothetical protein [Legionella pneumophila]